MNRDLDFLPYWEFKYGANSRACGLLDRTLISLNSMYNILINHKDNTSQLVFLQGKAVEDIQLLTCGDACSVICNNYRLIDKLENILPNIRNVNDVIKAGRLIHTLAKLVLNTQKYIYKLKLDKLVKNPNYKGVKQYKRK